MIITTEKTSACIHPYTYFQLSGQKRPKGEKMVQNCKKLCLLCLLFQKPYIYHMVFIYGTHVCIKEQYLQAFFSFLQNFDFRDH